ncbi:MAG: metalloregulator ArsR/SmtB family transcription factor [Erysipelotrichaceae bacterium]
MDEIQVSNICKAFSDLNRIKIIKMLSSGELCACKLLEQLNITQPTLSHHMQLLESCDLVKVRKDGKRTYYAINCLIFKQFKEFINNIGCGCIC